MLYSTILLCFLFVFSSCSAFLFLSSFGLLKHFWEFQHNLVLVFLNISLYIFLQWSYNVLKYTYMTCNSLLESIIYHFEWSLEIFHLDLFTFLTFKYYCLVYQVGLDFLFQLSKMVYETYREKYRVLHLSIFLLLFLSQCSKNSFIITFSFEEFPFRIDLLATNCFCFSSFEKISVSPSFLRVVSLDIEFKVNTSPLSALGKNSPYGLHSFHKNIIAIQIGIHLYVSSFQDFFFFFVMSNEKFNYNVSWYVFFEVYSVRGQFNFWKLQACVSSKLEFSTMIYSNAL